MLRSLKQQRTVMQQEKQKGHDMLRVEQMQISRQRSKTTQQDVWP